MKAQSREWGNLEINRAVAAVAAAIVVLVVLVAFVGDNTEQWFTRTAHVLWVFLLYQLVLGCLIGVLCFQLFVKVIEGRRISLRDLRKKNKVLAQALRKLASQASVTPLALKTVKERALFVLSRTRRRLFLSFLGALLLVAALLALLCMAATGFFEAQGKASFKGLDGNSSFGRHFYFVVGTMATLGNGDIVPSNAYGYFFVIATIYLGFFLFGMGLSFVIGHWFYLVNCLEREIEQVGEQASKRGTSS